jgi:membrane fusion protein, multidrug efflux system
MNRKALCVAGVVCVVAAVCLPGCKMNQNKTSAKADSTAVERIKVDVTVEKAIRRPIARERRLLGSLEAYRETDVGPLTPGRVKYLPVKIGDYVTEGQIVARMDDVQYAATDAQFQSVKSSYERMKGLYESNALPKAQFEGIEAQYTAMKRQLANLDENTVIKAPFAGVVTGKAVEEGELYSSPMAAMPGQSKGLVHITQLNPLKLDLNVDDETVGHLKRGMKVRLSVDQVNDSIPLYGIVEYVNPQANAMSKSFATRIVVQNPKNLLRPGFFAEAHVVLGEKQNALSVPAAAVVGNRVFVIEGGMAIARKVEVGWTSDKYAEILSGIDESAVVAVKGNKALPDSAQINIVMGEK